MKMEARHAMSLGLALFAFGLIAYLWAEREQVRTKLAQVSTPEFEFAKLRRQDMIDSEMSEPDASDEAGA